MLTLEEAQALVTSIQAAKAMGVDPARIVMQIYDSGFKAGQGITEATKKREAERRRLAYGPFAPKVGG
jgi:hypothetical protein